MTVKGKAIALIADAERRQSQFDQADALVLFRQAIKRVKV